MMSRAAIRLDVIPKDGNWGFDIPKLEAMLPAGTVDKNVERVYKKVWRFSSSFSTENFWHI